MSGATSIGDICGIQWFAARDIDVWLAEELRLNAGFARWFLDKIGGDSDITVPAYRVRISVCQGRETDVEALFHASADSTLAVLVEDKIKADFQSNQMEDYIKRGELGVKEGRWDRFAVVVFAPGYRTPFMNLPANVITLKFEEASEAMRLQDPNDSRLLYRAAFLKRAAQPTILVAENENQFVIQWWVAVNELVRSKFGDFFRPQTPRKTTYVNPRCADQPSYLRLDLKGDQGLAALAFIIFQRAASVNCCLPSLRQTTCTSYARKIGKTR